MHIPTQLLRSLAGVSGFDEAAFSLVHARSEQVSSVRLNPAKIPDPSATDTAGIMAHGETVPWSSFGYYLTERPSFTFDPLFHAGCYYVQEASSMFLEQAFRQTADLTRSLRVLDLCAAPGGKSTLLQSLMSKESLLVSNEVIKARAAVLEENITKWGAANVVVTNNDPVHFARLENYFDVLVVDAPCSGSGLFRRDPNAINEWSESNVQFCSQRQQRIVAAAWPSLKPGGILIYSTCSYSTEENEALLDWLLPQCNATSIRLQLQKDWQIVETVSSQQQAYGYRFYPDKIKGEGFFIGAVQKHRTDEVMDTNMPKNRLEQLNKAEKAITQTWLEESASLLLFKQKEAIVAIPRCFENDLLILQSALYIKQAGVTVGRLAGKDFIPAHAHALSNLINKNIPLVELTRPQAIQYLRKEELHSLTAPAGWTMAAHMGHALGWIKVLANRINNYYPKEWRILKQPANNNNEK